MIFIFQRAVGTYGETEVNCDNRPTGLRKVPFNPPQGPAPQALAESKQKSRCPARFGRKAGGRVLVHLAPLGKDARDRRTSTRPSRGPGPQLHSPEYGR